MSYCAKCGYVDHVDHRPGFSATTNCVLCGASVTTVTTEHSPSPEATNQMLLLSDNELVKDLRSRLEEEEGAAYNLQVDLNELQAENNSLRAENARLEDKGPGTVHARLTYLLDELHRLMPGVHNRIMSDPPEPKYIDYIKNLVSAYSMLAYEKERLQGAIATTLREYDK